MTGAQETLIRRRQVLIDRAAALHAPRAPWGVSVYEAQSGCWESRLRRRPRSDFEEIGSPASTIRRSASPGRAGILHRPGRPCHLRGNDALGRALYSPGRSPHPTLPRQPSSTAHTWPTTRCPRRPSASARSSQTAACASRRPWVPGCRRSAFSTVSRPPWPSSIPPSLLFPSTSWLARSRPGSRGPLRPTHGTHQQQRLPPPQNCAGPVAGSQAEASGSACCRRCRRRPGHRVAPCSRRQRRPQASGRPRGAEGAFGAALRRDTGAGRIGWDR